MALTGIIFALVPIALQFGMFLGFLARILETLVELDPGQAIPVGLRVDAYIQVDSR